MIIHHLNCVSACPVGGRFMDGISTGPRRARLTSHCLLVESRGSLVLVDTGYGLRDVHAPRTRLSKLFLGLARPVLDEDMTAIRQIERMGFDPRDVRHIVLTHLDCDHAGGLDDFPWATVHMLDAEREAATAQRTVLDRMRYRPAQWSTRDRWRTYAPAEGEAWLGLPCVRGLEALEAEIVLVPLIGHTLGHCGVAVRRADGGWLLHAGDAYVYFDEMNLERPSCTPGLRAYQWLMDADHTRRLANQHRLRTLLHERGADLTIVCSHDVREFEQASGRTCDTPPPRVRETRDGVPIVDEGAIDAAPPRGGGAPVVRVRPAREHHAPRLR